MKLPSPGEGVGANTPLPNAPANKRFTAVCGGNYNGVEYTAQIMAHEIAHNFGVVSPYAPQNDGRYHSINRVLMDPFAFDFVRLRPYDSHWPSTGPFLEDAMVALLSQGKDMTLFDAYDWEDLRKKLVDLSVQNLKSYESESQEDQVEDITKAYDNLQKIDVHKPESTLTPKLGFEWHWTSLGFRRVVQVKPTKNRSGLAPNVELMLSALRDIGTKEVYAPIEGKSLDIIISPKRINSAICEIGDVRSIG